MKIKDVVIDFETLGNGSNAAVVDLALLAFDPDPTVMETFEELIARGKRIKFDIQSQKGKRLIDIPTTTWWQKQGPEAKAGLKPSVDDVDTLTGIKQAVAYCKENDVDQYNSLMWCRGQSFDFPIFVDLLRDVERDKGVPETEISTYNTEPVAFWNQRDLRTAIEALSLTRKLCTTPLPRGTLNGFVAHNSVHDCAKDILMLKYAQRYALGLEDCPSLDDCDPLSLPTR